MGARRAVTDFIGTALTQKTGVLSDGVRHVVPNVQTVQAVQPPPSSSPADAGEEQGWGLERSVAVELSEAIERIERFFMRNLGC